MKTLLLFVLSSLATAPSFAAVASSTFVNPQNGNSYFLLSDATWELAQAEAVTLGGNLASINDAAENQWLVDTFASVIPGSEPIAWIGLNDIALEGSHTWISGEPLAYTNWITGEPNNLNDEDWGEIYLFDGFTIQNQPISAGQWNDNNTSQGPRQAIVEIVVPEPSSLVILCGLSFLGLAGKRTR